MKLKFDEIFDINSNGDIKAKIKVQIDDIKYFVGDIITNTKCEGFDLKDSDADEYDYIIKLPETFLEGRIKH